MRRTTPKLPPQAKAAKAPPSKRSAPSHLVTWAAGQELPEWANAATCVAIVQHRTGIAVTKWSIESLPVRSKSVLAVTYFNVADVLAEMGRILDEAPVVRRGTRKSPPADEPPRRASRRKRSPP